MATAIPCDHLQGAPMIAFDSTIPVVVVIVIVVIIPSNISKSINMLLRGIY